MNPLLVVAVTTVLILASAFFVVIEFSLLGARRHRLEALAPTDRAARAALRGMNELTIMLAGAQLGITACTFALGAITKPALDYALAPLFTSWGLPAWLAGGAAFVLALLAVTFLHLVIGEMAPKSWAIAHPELAARVIGTPARAFVQVFRPLLVFANHLANILVRRTGVDPVESAAVGGRDSATIRQLVEYSGEVGSLEPELHDQIARVMDLQNLTVGDIARPGGGLTRVGPDASVADVRAAAMRSGHLRILVTGGGLRDTRVVHVRDTLLEQDEARAVDFARPALVIPGSTPVYEAVARMRATSVQLAVVEHAGGEIRVVTLADVIRRILPGFSDVKALRATRTPAPGPATDPT